MQASCGWWWWQWMTHLSRPCALDEIWVEGLLPTVQALCTRALRECLCDARPLVCAILGNKLLQERILVVCTGQGLSW